MIRTIDGLYRRDGGLWPSSYPWYTWSELEDNFLENFQRWAGYSETYLAALAIIESVSNSGLSDRFVANSGWLDPTLRVALADLDARERDAISIPGNMWGNSSPSKGCVRIQHESFSGKVEDIQRPIADAVPLFWRFVSEKFGIDYRHEENTR